MGAQGIENLPNDFESLIVFQSDRGLHSFGDGNRQNDVPVVLAGRFAHDAPDRLHNVHHGVAGVEEQHRVQGGHIHAFGQAASIGQDAAFILGDNTFEPHQFGISFQGVVGSIDVADLAAQAAVGVIDRVAVVLAGIQ